MTPVGSRLQLKLDDEVRRMANEWFFKWHYIGRDGPVEIDSFRGKPIVYGGIKFSGSAHIVYWETIQYYLRKKISTTFDELETEIKPYPVEIRREAMHESERLVQTFASRIRRMAIEKDRILRGDGMNFPAEHDFGKWSGAGPGDIKVRADSLLRIYGETVREQTSFWQKANAVWDEHRWWIGGLGFAIGLVGLLSIF